MTKNDIVNELNKMGYEVREEKVVKNGVEFLGISIIDSDRYMIPVFYVEDIIMKAEQSGATVKDIVREMLQIHNDALRESEELNKPLHFSELPLPCGTVVPMEVASNSRDSYPFLTKRLAVRTNQGIFTYAAIPLTGIPFGFSLWNPYTSGAERNV